MFAGFPYQSPLLTMVSLNQVRVSKNLSPSYTGENSCVWMSPAVRKREIIWVDEGKLSRNKGFCHQTKKCRLTKCSRRHLWSLVTVEKILVAKKIARTRKQIFFFYKTRSRLLTKQTIFCVVRTDPYFRWRFLNWVTPEKILIFRTILFTQELVVN